MSLMQALGRGQGYLKAGFLGFPKAGKTFTAVELAVAVRKTMGDDGPIAFFDTESGSEYVAGKVREATGKDLVGVRSRSFDDLLAVGRECVETGASVLIVDSITHVWRELCDAYLKQVNEQRAAKRQGPRTRLEFQDWSTIKGRWAAWTDFFLNSRLHIVICGRAGYEYDFEDREDGTGKDLVKTGVKMKVETEFGFEPSLLVQMERVLVASGDEKKWIARATVIGDRFDTINGQSFDNPTGDAFLPHLELLKPGAHAPIDTAVKSDLHLTEDGDASWQREKRDRTILSEEVQGELLRAWPGATTEEKKAKAEALERAFGTRSWSKVSEATRSDALRAGLEILRGIVAEAIAARDAEPATAGAEK